MDADTGGGTLNEHQVAMQFERRLASIEEQLVALSQVPRQLSTVLETLTSVQASLSEPVVLPQHFGPSGLEAAARASGYAPSPPGLSRIRSKGPARSATRSETLTSSSSTSMSNRMHPLIGHPATMVFGEESPSHAAEASCKQRRSSTHSDDPSMSQLYRQRRTSIRSNHSNDPALGPVLLTSRPSKGVSSTAWPQRRPSTSSSRSCGRVVIANKSFDAVAPNSVPSPRSNPDTDRSFVGTKDSEIVCCTETVPEGVEGSVSFEDAEANRKLSAKTSLSLADTRPSADRGSGSLALMDLGSEIRGRRAWVLLPSSLPRLFWDSLMVLLTVLVGLVVPVELIYLRDDFSIPGVAVHLCSAVWILDIAFNFRTGFFRAGKLVLCPRLIAKRYASTWLIVDILAAWPPLLAPSDATGTRIVHALKLLRLARLGPMLVGLQREHHHLGLPVRVGLLVLLTIHATTCAWRVSLRFDDGNGVVGGSTAQPPAWVDVYIEDMYWVMMTMTTVGFGDVHPVGTGSRVFAILAMLVAPIFFGTIVSLLTHVTDGIFNDEIDAQVAEAARFMRLRRLPLELQRRVELNLRYHIREERLTLAPGLFSKLSPAVQREVSLELLRSTVLNFPLFRDVLHSFIAELAQAHTWVKCLPGDLVVEEGQLMQEVVFVIRGRLQMQWGPGFQEGEGPCVPDEEFEDFNGVHDVEVSAGAWFSEAALFFDDRIRSATVFAATESELAVLASGEYHRIVQKYPRLLKRHKNIEEALRTGNLSLKDLAYMKPPDESAQEPWQCRVWPCDPRR